ncbi:MAG: hypothetical protein II969_17720 [Anaerolineaceae bacterium]|nr:hypothetical protein [Anaerolineaceae bacterium]
MRNDKRLLIGKAGKNIAIVQECSTAWEIGKGLIGKEKPVLNRDNLYEGLLLRIPGWRQKFSGFINSIHMIGMKYLISVFWIYDSKIVDKVIAFPGFHVYSPSHPSSAVLELPEMAFCEFNVGDLITISNIDHPICSQTE